MEVFKKDNPNFEKIWWCAETMKKLPKHTPNRELWKYYLYVPENTNKMIWAMECQIKEITFEKLTPLLPGWYTVAAKKKNQYIYLEKYDGVISMPDYNKYIDNKNKNLYGSFNGETRQGIAEINRYLIMNINCKYLFDTLFLESIPPGNYEIGIIDGLILFINNIYSFYFMCMIKLEKKEKDLNHG